MVWSFLSEGEEELPAWIISFVCVAGSNILIEDTTDFANFLRILKNCILSIINLQTLSLH